MLYLLLLPAFKQTEDMFFDADDMEKFADEGTMDDDADLEGESRVRDERVCEVPPAVSQPGNFYEGGGDIRSRVHQPHSF